jgi:Fibronectin type III domain
MHTKLIRVVAGVAALAAASVGLFSASAAALPPGSPSAGLVSVTPGTGTAATSITLAPPAGASCQGDSAGAGYRWQGFIASASVDAGTLTYAGGAGPNAVAGAVVFPLLSTTSSPLVDMNTAPAVAPNVTGLITGIPAVDFSGFPAGTFPNGVYNVGFACTLTNATTRFWQSPITVTNPGGVFTFAFGAAPSAPVLNSPLTSGNGTLAGTFTEAPAAPAVTGYLVTAVPTVGATVTSPVAAAATSFTLTGLVNGTSYSVSLTATNTAGTSAASNTVTGTPALAAQPPVTNLQAAPAPNAAVLTWTPPAGTATVTGYTVGVSPTVVGAPFTIVGPANTFTVNGLTAGTVYTFTVTATYAAPNTGTPATVQLAPPGDAVIMQEITVNRPVGALVLTQVCGVFGALPLEPASPGFPQLNAAVFSAASPTAPTLDAAHLNPDPKFAGYPYPVDPVTGVPNPTYPTHCALNLGVSHLVTTGPEAGKYFQTDGRLNQVTIIDTRDTDAGWTVSGSVTNFTSGSNSFSGNYLGWSPVKSSDSGVTFEGYDQTVVAGGIVLPGAGVLPGLPASTLGLMTNKTLASAAPNVGLGQATLDARIKLLIPVTANAGTYNATLTLSAV